MHSDTPRPGDEPLPPIGDPPPDPAPPEGDPPSEPPAPQPPGPINGRVHGGEKTIQWSACVCAGAGGVKVGHWIG